MYLRKISNQNYPSGKIFDASAYGGDLPESLDWRNKGAVSSVKNQVARVKEKATLFDLTTLQTDILCLRT